MLCLVLPLPVINSTPELAAFYSSDSPTAVEEAAAYHNCSCTIHPHGPHAQPKATVHLVVTETGFQLDFSPATCWPGEKQHLLELSFSMLLFQQKKSA